MESSDSIKELSTAFAAAQAELKNATFDAVNPHFKNKYATLAAIRDTVCPVLSKHGLAVIQGTAFDGSVATVNTRLVHKSGEWIESVYPFALDKPQQMGSALTYARRYGLAAICGIASEEDDDANTGNDTDKKPASKPKMESRDVYSKISLGINQIINTGTLGDLRLWYKSHTKEIAEFPDDWNLAIHKEFDDARDALKATAA